MLPTIRGPSPVTGSYNAVWLKSAGYAHPTERERTKPDAHRTASSAAYDEVMYARVVLGLEAWKTSQASWAVRLAIAGHDASKKGARNTGRMASWTA